MNVIKIIDEVGKELKKLLGIGLKKVNFVMSTYKLTRLARLVSSGNYTASIQGARPVDQATKDFSLLCVYFDPIRLAAQFFCSNQIQRMAFR